MANRVEISGLSALMAALTAACGAQSASVEPGNTRPAAAYNSSGGTVHNQAPVNERFRTLDEYLAFLEKTQGPVDGPWYRLVRPGVYELAPGNLRVLGGDGNEQKRTFTRQELMEQFGFNN